jgi:hypothetical protein
MNCEERDRSFRAVAPNPPFLRFGGGLAQFKTPKIPPARVSEGRVTPPGGAQSRHRTAYEGQAYFEYPYSFLL